MNTARTKPESRSHLMLHTAAAFITTLLCADTTSAQLTPPAATSAASQVDTDQSKSVTPEKIESLKSRIQQATDLDDETRKKLLDMAQQAADALSRAAKLNEQMRRDQAAVNEISTTVAQLNARLTEPPPPELADVPKDASLAELQAALAARQALLQEARARLATEESNAAKITERRSRLSSDIAALSENIAQVRKQLETPPPPDQHPLATEAMQLLQQARLKELSAQGPAWQAELARLDAEKAVDLPQLRVRLAQQQVNLLQREVDTLNRRIARKRSEDARYIAEQLHAFADGMVAPSPFSQSDTYFVGPLTDPKHRERAQKTAELTTEIVQTAAELSQVTARAEQSKKRLDELRAQQKRISEKIDRVGLTGAIGLELRRQLRSLADTRRIQAECQQRQTLMQELEYKRLELEDRIKELSAELDLLKQQAGTDLSTNIELRLVSDELQTSTMLERSLGELFTRYADLDTSEQEFIRETKKFEAFIRERVLWIRSHKLPQLADSAEIIQTLNWLMSPRQLQQIAESLYADTTDRPWLYVAMILLATVLTAVQSRFRRTVTRIGAVAEKKTCREFLPTVRAAVLTLILALHWPAIMAFLSWRLTSGPVATDLSRAVGRGLAVVAIASLVLNTLRQMCRPAGLALSHFEWPAAAVRTLRLRCYALVAFFLPALFLVQVLHETEELRTADALERLVFVSAMMILMHFQQAVLHPVKGVFSTWLSANRNHWINRLQWPLFIIVISIPLILAGLAVVGYYYTALELSWRLYGSTVLLTALFVLRAFLLRWFRVRHRDLRIRQARQRRQALADAAAASDTSTLPSPPKEDPVDLQEVSLQTQRLVNSGLSLIGLLLLWFVWVDVLPALAMLDAWELWSTTVDVTVEETDAGGERSYRTESRVQAITVADAFTAIIITLMTFTIARNTPGLLEITVLNRLPLDAATRYAIQMVSRYAVTVVGLALAFGAIGVGWSKVQWLVAALTVGLGFGLQEIFANFVSGMIILLERPVRIGDVVTIGDVSGTVSRIQIRATTITDWDRKEYIVPNKEFVTGRLLNWTLSDKTNRVVIDVGVAYGSDTVQARELLLEVAHKHPEVLSDPAPVATFESFGDSTLNLRLRCYLPNLDNRLQTITELHENIDRAFRDAKIEIAFPQRDLHIRSLPENAGGMMNPAAQGSAPDATKP